MTEVFCGIDWAEGHQDIALVDQQGQVLVSLRIEDTAGGLAKLLEMLCAAGDHPEDRIPVAIETTRGLLVAALRSSGRDVYASNPMAVSRYRDRHTVSRKKSDAQDAAAPAHILRTDRHGPAGRSLGTAAIIQPDPVTAAGVLPLHPSGLPEQRRSGHAGRPGTAERRAHPRESSPAHQVTDPADPGQSRKDTEPRGCRR